MEDAYILLKGCSTANKIGVQGSLTNTRYTLGKDMGAYLPELETSFNKLRSMGLPVAEEIQVVILLVSLIN